MDTSFSAETCAELHNQLLQKAIANNPNATVHQGLLVHQILQATPEFTSIPNLEDLPVYRFLSLLDTYSVHHGLSLVTPHARQPDTSDMFLDPILYPDNPTVIKLYGGGWGLEDHGLLFDMRTGLAHWHMAPHKPAPQEQWQPLETVLRIWINDWSTGKFYFDVASNRPTMRSWTDADLESSLKAWDLLIQAIQSRRVESASSTAQLQPLDTSLIQQYAVSPFAAEFLSKATRPTFKFIAPGITTFSPESFTHIYSTEPQHSQRLRWISNSEPDEYPSLILPAEACVPLPARDPEFDQNWGFGKFTVSRTAGLYIDADGLYGNGVQFVDPFGRISAFTHEPRQCPWDLSRSPSLAETLGKWKDLVATGVWHIDENGVADGLEWFDERSRTPRREDLRLKWTH